MEIIIGIIIMKDKKKLFLIVIGQGEDFMSTYMRIGVTVDLQTGDRIYLDNLITDTGELKQTLVNYNYENEFAPPIDDEEAEEIIYNASISEVKYLEEIYKKDSFVYNFIFTYMMKKPSFYVTNKQIVIIRDENEYNDVFLDFD
jgi:hypothetical protein